MSGLAAKRYGTFMKIVLIILIIALKGTCSAQNIVGVELSSCDKNSYPEYMHHQRLISKGIINDTLFLRIGLVRNCEFVPEINCVKNGDSLVFSVQNVSDMYAGCICCYEIDLKITGIIDTNFTSYIGKTELKKLGNKYIFPSLTEIESHQEINKLNADGLEVGIWNIYDPESIFLKAKFYYFIDESGKSRSKWRISYNKDGQISEVCALTSIDSEGISNVTCASREQYLRLKINVP